MREATRPGSVLLGFGLGLLDGAKRCGLLTAIFLAITFTMGLATGANAGLTADGPTTAAVRGEFATISESVAEETAGAPDVLGQFAVAVAEGSEAVAVAGYGVGVAYPTVTGLAVWPLTIGILLAMSLWVTSIASRWSA